MPNLFTAVETVMYRLARIAFIGATTLLAAAGA